ncbi:MAG: hypothetical protein M0Q44_01275 [Methylobacter sp.]|jgi:hypothetical protein|nr:hypothetical protein [Methylobacter sp.]
MTETIDSTALKEDIALIINAMVVKNADTGEDNAHEHYERHYYRETGVDRLPEPIQAVMLDMVCTMGPVAAIKALQRSLKPFGRGVKIDGIIGDKTTAASLLACAVYRQRLLDFIIAENMEYCARRDAPPTPKTSFESKTTVAMFRAEQCKVVKIFGLRMKEAREIANFSQIEAAKLLGYSNSSKLAKVEGASDTNSIPMWLITKASEVYDVSTDFLFGLSDDWERDPAVSRQRNVGHWVHEHWKNANAAQVAAIMMLNKRLEVVEKATAGAVAGSKKVYDMLSQVRKLNPEFQQMKNVINLILAADRAMDDARASDAELKKFHCVIDLSKKTQGVGLVKNWDVFDDE